MVPLMIAAGGAGHPPSGPGGQAASAGFPNNTIFFVDDLQVVDDGTYNNFVRIALSPPPSPPAGQNPVYHTYFLIPKDRLTGPNPAVAQAWIAMLVSRLRDCSVGVEPKARDNDPIADGSIAKPYELVGLSYGSLAGTNGQGECPRSTARDDPHLGLFYGQTPPPA